MRCWFPLAMLVLALPGCAVAPRDTRAAYEPVTDVTEGRSPMAELPAAAGDVVALMQNQTRGILTQRIVLRGDADTFGENAIVVKVDRGPRHPADIDGPVGRPDKPMIGAELDENFAGVDMALSQTFARNSFGPFGYALGHPRAGVTCVYAWQWGMARPQRLGDAPDGAPSMPVEPTSVRVRLCRSTLSEIDMVALLRGLQIFPPNSRAAYLDPEFAGAGETNGDALSAAGVGYFVGPNVARVPIHDRARHAHRHRRQKVAHRFVHQHEREAMREERAAANYDPALRGVVAVPLPSGGAPSAANNPLLAPLAATAAAPRAPANDMPLPARAAAVERIAPAPVNAGTIPLPN